MSYHLVINEQQRKFIEEALRQYPVDGLSMQPGSGIHISSEREEFDLLLDMWSTMPQVEEKNPGILHGLCELG